MQRSRIFPALYDQLGEDSAAQAVAEWAATDNVYRKLPRPQSEYIRILIINKASDDTVCDAWNEAENRINDPYKFKDMNEQLKDYRYYLCSIGCQEIVKYLGCP